MSNSLTRPSTLDFIYCPIYRCPYGRALYIISGGHPTRHVHQQKLFGVLMHAPASQDNIIVPPVLASGCTTYQLWPQYVIVVGFGSLLFPLLPLRHLYRRLHGYLCNMSNVMFYTRPSVRGRANQTNSEVHMYGEQGLTFLL